MTRKTKRILGNPHSYFVVTKIWLRIANNTSSLSKSIDSCDWDEQEKFFHKYDKIWQGILGELLVILIHIFVATKIWLRIANHTSSLSKSIDSCDWADQEKSLYKCDKIWQGTLDDILAIFIHIFVPTKIWLRIANNTSRLSQFIDSCD